MPLRSIPLVVACLALLLGAAAPTTKPVKVYILSGQSNMDGRGKASELAGDLARWAKPQPDVSIAYSNSTRRGPYATDGFVPLEASRSTASGSETKGFPEES